MRIPTYVVALVLVPVLAIAQQTPQQAPPRQADPTDPTRADFMSAAEVQAHLSIPGNFGVFSLAPYNVNVEHRFPVPQAASMHDHDAELFVVLDGEGTIVTGGKLTDGKRSNPENWTGTG